MERVVISAQSTIRSATERFLDDKHELSPRTIRTYSWWLEKFVRFVGDQPLDHSLAVLFFADLKSAGHGLSYRNQAFRI